MEPGTGSVGKEIWEVNIDEMRGIMVCVECGEYQFSVESKGPAIYLVTRYLEPDVVTGKMDMQTTRKWMLSEHITRSELVQTALKCVITSMEHRAREKFNYKGQRVFGPHFDVEALVELAESGKTDVRQ